MARVWYGMVKMSGGQLNEAEQTMLDAVKAAPQDDRAWNGLFTFYVRTDNKNKAREILQQMMTQANMSPERRAFVLAQGYEAMGDDAEAEAAYRQAFKDFPDNQRIRTRLAQFYLARAGSNAYSAQKGIEVLQEIVRRDPQDGQAKRTLATLLAAEGGDQWREALRLLGDTGGKDAASRRLEGILLFQRDGADNLAAARKIFEELSESPAADPQDRLLLARIWNARERRPPPGTSYARLAEQQPPDSRALTFYVDFLIRHRELDEAQRGCRCFKRPASRRSAWACSNCRRSSSLAQGQTASVVERIDPPIVQQFSTLADSKRADKITLAGDAGDMYTRLGLLAAAEAWYRRLLELDSTRIAPLATCLARQNRFAEALDICESVSAKSGADVAASALADVLTAGSPSAADYERAEPILAAAEQKSANDANVLLKISNVRIVQGKLDDAIRLLEKIVQLDAKNVLALNNLAMIMSERPGQREKAIKYIDQALAITGDRPDLCDTKGSIYLYDNQPAEAVKCLEFAARTAGSNPIIQFHLAAAYFGTNKLEDAARCFRESMAAGLEKQLLTDSDRKLMADMQRLLQSPSPDSKQ